MSNSGEISTVERAFQLAREGSCKTIAQIESRLVRERYEQVREQLSGLTIRSQLREILKATTAKSNV